MATIATRATSGLATSRRAAVRPSLARRAVVVKASAHKAEKVRTVRGMGSAVPEEYCA
jgi:hypothetical protein